MTVFMFSGQGSQYFHMGRALYDGDDVFRQWMVRLDDTARRSAGGSVIETLYSDAHGKGDPFDRTLLTHPAIFMVEYSLAQSLIRAGVRPDMVLGVSLGTFAAAAVAGFIDVEDALTAVIRQAIALEERCQPGGMTAVLADPALFAENFLSGRSELAAVNFSSHFVVAARLAELQAIEAALRKRAIGYQRLPVSFPFHSQWIDEAKAPFDSFMRWITRRQGRLPLACCDQAAILTDLPDDYFWDVVRHPIRFRDTTARLERPGACRYVDVGPAGTLATFLKYGMPATTTSTVHAILTPYGGDQRNLAAVLASLEMQPVVKDKAAMRIFALSDVHIDYDANARWIADLSLAEYQDDVLILAGDVTDTRRLLDWCLTTLAKRFRKVLFVPGNHDLWVIRDDRDKTSLQKFDEVCTVVESSGASMQEFRERGVSIVPLLAWYDNSFGEPSEELRSMWMDYRACRWPSGFTEKDVAAHFAARNTRPAGLAGDTVITYSHFLPRIDVMPEFIPCAGTLLYPILGSAQLECQLRRFKPDIHVYGHSHVNRHVKIDGVVYINNAFGYPSETRITAKRLMCIHEH